MEIHRVLIALKGSGITVVEPRIWRIMEPNKPFRQLPWWMFVSQIKNASAGFSGPMWREERSKVVWSEFYFPWKMHYKMQLWPSVTLNRQRYDVFTLITTRSATEGAKRVGRCDTWPSRGIMGNHTSLTAQTSSACFEGKYETIDIVSRYFDGN